MWDLPLISLHHLIALAFRAYILSWLPRVTKDRSLLPQIHESILQPTLSPILNRIAEDPSIIVDLILLDLPALVHLHIETLHSAQRALTLPITGEFSVADGYHARLSLSFLEPYRPSPDTKNQSEHSNHANHSKHAKHALPVEYEVSPEWLTAITGSVISLYLPPEEMACVPEVIMLREIIGRVILGGMARKIQQPWFWWSVGLKLLGPSPTPTSILIPPRSTSQRSTLNLILVALNRFYHAVSFLLQFPTWLLGVWAESPPLESRYRECSVPLILIVRSLVPNPSWTLRIILSTFELLLTFCSPIIDRCVDLPALRSYFVTLSRLDTVPPPPPLCPQ